MEGGDSSIYALRASASPKDKAEAKVTSVKGNSSDHGIEDVF